MLRVWRDVDSNAPGFHSVGHTWVGLSLIHYSDRPASCLVKRGPAEHVKISMKMFCRHLEFGAMVHSWRLVVPGRQSQLPFAKIFLDVAVREFVPSICRQKQSRNQPNCCLEHMQIWRGQHRHKRDDWDDKRHVENRTIDIYFCLSQLLRCLELTPPEGDNQCLAFPFLMIRIPILGAFVLWSHDLISCCDVCYFTHCSRRHPLDTKGDELHFLLLIKV